MRRPNRSRSRSRSRSRGGARAKQQPQQWTGPQPYSVQEDSTNFAGRLFRWQDFEYVVSKETEKVLYLNCRRLRTPNKAPARCQARAKLDKKTDRFYVAGEHICQYLDFEK